MMLIIIHSLLFFPAPVSRAQKHPTKAEIILAQATADLFLRRLDETGDFSQVIDEMYVGDFIDRFLHKQTRQVEESNSPSFEILFASNLRCRRDLLKLATIEDWRRLYTAINNFVYHGLVIGLNEAADDFLNGREPKDEILDNLIPPTVITLFNNHPVLKDFLGKDDKPKSGERTKKRQSSAVRKKSEPKSIETPEEMQNVTETFQEALRLLLEGHGAGSPKLTDNAKKTIDLFKQIESMESTLEVNDEGDFGLRAGVRLLAFQTPIKFMLVVAEINGKQKIVWGQFPAHIC